MSYQPEVTKDACAGSYPIDVKKRVDFITALPLEIVAEHIVPKMISNNPPYFHCRYKTGYFGVCREWSKRLAVCDSSIKFLIGDELLSDTDWKRVEAVACYMNILFVTSRGEKAIMEFVRYGPFLALSDLTITGSNLHLEGARITCDQKVEPLQLFELLNQCPKLSRLNLMKDTAFRLPGDIHHNTRYHNVHQLAFTYGPSSRSIAIKLLQHFPALRALRLWSPPTCFDDVAMIIQYCPKLQQLFLGDTTDTENVLCHQGESEGLLLLSIYGVRYDEYKIMRFLQEHCATLQVFELEHATPYPSPDSMLCNDPAMLYQLRYLRFHGNLYPDTARLMRWIISRSPEIGLVEAFDGYVNGTILDDLAARPMKEIINLRYSAKSITEHEYRFVKHHLELGMDSSLQVIKCTIGSLPKNSVGWIYLIPALKQLTSLDLSFENDALVKLSKLEDFLRLVARGCDSLQNVTLNLRYWIPRQEWILPLSQHPHLKSMVIVSHSIPSEELLEHFRHLDLLHLKPKTFDYKAILLLERKLPFLKCTQQNVSLFE